MPDAPELEVQEAGALVAGDISVTLAADGALDVREVPKRWALARLKDLSFCEAGYPDVLRDHPNATLRYYFKQRCSCTDIRLACARVRFALSARSGCRCCERSPGAAGTAGGRKRKSKEELAHSCMH